MKKIYIPFLLSFFIQYAQTGADIDGDGILDQDDNCINVLVLNYHLYKFIFVFSLKQNDIFKVKLSSFLLLFITQG